MTTKANTEIRMFAKSDLKVVQQLINDTIDISYFSTYPQQALNFFKGFHSVERIMERSQKGKTIVLEKNGKIIGTGSFLNGEILGVFINPNFQHQGYGIQLMLELEQIAIAHNYNKVSLSISLPSREFYEGLGYRISKECSFQVKNGKYLAYWTASKQLQKKTDG
jgi:histone acetyltransferase (RNA polymerase elongator complex component)